MPEVLDESGLSVLDENIVASRTAVHNGIAAYFGGTWVQNIRGYQNGQLTNYGLGTVRAGWSKRFNMADLFADIPAGRGMGAYVIVELGPDREVKRGIAGAPVLDSNGNIIAGGTKLQIYPVILHGFHVAQKAYADDARADIDALTEQIKYTMRIDRTLGMGGIIIDGGMTSYGIQVRVYQPGFDPKDRVGTYFTVRFEVRAMIIA